MPPSCLVSGLGGGRRSALRYRQFGGSGLGCPSDMLIQILLNSIISALVLSLVALGFNLIFNATKVFHLAHGAMYASAVYSAVAFRALLRGFASESVATVVALALSLLL